MEGFKEDEKGKRRASVMSSLSLSLRQRGDFSLICYPVA